MTSPLLRIQAFRGYSKTSVKRPLTIDKANILMTDGSLMKVESIAECSPLEHSAILLTCIKRQLVLKTNLCFFESGRFTQVLLYILVQQNCYMCWLCLWAYF